MPPPELPEPALPEPDATPTKPPLTAEERLSHMHKGLEETLIKDVRDPVVLRALIAYLNNLLDPPLMEGGEQYRFLYFLEERIKLKSALYRVKEEKHAKRLVDLLHDYLCFDSKSPLGKTAAAENVHALQNRVRTSNVKRIAQERVRELQILTKRQNTGADARDVLRAKKPRERRD